MGEINGSLIMSIRRERIVSRKESAVKTERWYQVLD